MEELEQRIHDFADQFSGIGDIQQQMIADNLLLQAQADPNFLDKFEILEQQNILSEVGVGNDALGMSFQLGGQNPGVSLTTANPDALTMTLSQEGFQLTDYMLTEIGEFAVNNANGQIAKMDTNIERGRIPPERTIDRVTNQINDTSSLRQDLVESGLDIPEINQLSPASQEHFPSVGTATPQTSAQQPQTAEPPAVPEGDPISVLEHHESGIDVYQYGNGQIVITSSGQLKDGDPLVGGEIIYDPESGVLHHSNVREIRSLDEQANIETSANYPVSMAAGNPTLALTESEIVVSDHAGPGEGHETGVFTVASESGFLTAQIFDRGAVSQGAVRINATDPETGMQTLIVADENTVMVATMDTEGQVLTSGDIELDQSFTQDDFRYQAPATTPSTFGMD